MVDDDRGRVDAATAAWIEAVVARHTAAYSRPEFLKAVRALSSRYVEARATLSSRSPLDSAGKRAAFAGFYAPLHYLLTHAIVGSLNRASSPARVIDLGCGTGVAGLAWARASSPTAMVTGIDLNSWALGELPWNARTLRVTARTRRASLVTSLEEEVGARPPRTRLDTTGIVCAWSLNELDRPDRDRALTALLDAHRRGASVLVIEPLALTAVPWWAAWQPKVADAGGRTDEWRFPPALPAPLADLDEAAGFRREHLTARSFWLAPVS